ncbi:MAG: PaaI family thioesterase [Thermoleophilia bacterium]
MNARLAALNEAARTALPGLLGIEVVHVDGPHVHARLRLHEGLTAPNGYLHGGTVVAFADTACGYGCMLGLPEGHPGFTTIELKANLVGTALEGVIVCDARRVHGGRTTEVWDAEVATEDGRRLALFRCTQLILDPERRR